MVLICISLLANDVDYFFNVLFGYLNTFFREMSIVLPTFKLSYKNSFCINGLFKGSMTTTKMG